MSNKNGMSSQLASRKVTYGNVVRHLVRREVAFTELFTKRSVGKNEREHQTGGQGPGRIPGNSPKVLSESMLAITVSMNYIPDCVAKRVIPDYTTENS
jgi:hypothetical protein